MPEHEGFTPGETFRENNEQEAFETVFDSGYQPVPWGGEGQEAKVLIEKTPDGKFRVLTGIKNDTTFREEMGHPPLDSSETVGFGWAAEAPAARDFNNQEEAQEFADSMTKEMDRWLDDDFEHQ